MRSLFELHRLFALLVVVATTTAATSASNDATTNASSTHASYIYLPDRRVQEELAIGSLLIDVSEEMASMHKRNNNNNNNDDDGEDQDDTQHYAFLEDDAHSSSASTYLLLDAVTGRVTSKRYMDRESMCMNKHCLNSCTHHSSSSSQPHIHHSRAGKRNKAGDDDAGSCRLHVQVLLIPSYTIVSVHLLVQDINDHAPTFATHVGGGGGEHVRLSVREDVPIGHRIALPRAFDPDAGDNAIRTYRLLTVAPLVSPLTTAAKKQQLKQNESRTSSSSSTDTFELVVDRANETTTDTDNIEVEEGEEEDGSIATAQLVVRRALDRELLATAYELLIEACDNGAPAPQCGQLRVTLDVEDANDHAPVFDHSAYSFSIGIVDNFDI